MTTAKSDDFIAFDFWREGNKNLVGGVYWRGDRSSWRDEQIFG